ncbi:MAG: pentapeptide repeat-containing protein [Candidatus Thiosymbion ectosymbiont of Robbea hypermnestra]|nr:pentapeptide repeat-containing protein [Candidatus Thiosymbion ectosymbiont of Robbea hypermnestra]
MSHSWNANRWSLEQSGILAEVALLRAAADESARHVRMLYFTFLLFAFYVAVIAFSTNDEQLLKGAGAHLPLLDVELPLLAFYIVVPLLVLIFHSHLLNQFFLLSRKLFRLDQALRSLPAGQETTQRELPFPLIFSYQIIGTHHPSLIRWSFQAAVTVTVLLLPLVLLALLQWKFLPYHGAWITFEHRVVFTLDLLLLWLFWPRLSSRSGRWRAWFPYSRRWRLWGEAWCLTRPRNWYQRIRMGGVWMSTFLPLLGVWLLLVPPGSGLEWFMGYQEWLDGIHRNLVLRERTLMRREPPVALLFAGHVKTDEERAKLWQEAGEGLDLRGRDLRYADFSGSKLWNADLREARLQEADLRRTQLQGANLREARLPGADLWRARLQGASLWMAQLPGTYFIGAQLQGANLGSAELPGANLRETRLQGANLWEARLQGVNLEKAQLQGANLGEARLQDANLGKARLQGVNLERAQLQGANLREARLPGADLREAQLQGANLEEARLPGANLRDAVVYGTGFRNAELSLADLRALRSSPVEAELASPLMSLFGKRSAFSGIEALEDRLTREGEHWSEAGRERVAQAIERFWSIVFDPPLAPTRLSPLQGFDVMHDQEGLFAAWPAPAAAGFEQARADYRTALACADPYIAKGMWRQAKPPDWSEEKPDPVLEQTLTERAASGECPVLAEILEKNP